MLTAKGGVFAEPGIYVSASRKVEVFFRTLPALFLDVISNYAL
jgi:hypothetical protein